MSSIVGVPSSRLFGPWVRALHLTRRLTPFTILSGLICAALAFLALYPLGRMVLGVFVTDGHLDASPVRQALTEAGIGQVVGTTVILVASSGAIALVIGSILAWFSERTNASLGKVTDTLPLIPFLMPPIAGAIGWSLLLSPRAGLLNAFVRFCLDRVGVHLTNGPFNIYSWGGLIFVYTLYQIPFAYLMMSAGLRNLDAELEEQARICGADPFRTMWTVTLRAIRPNLVAAAMLMIWFGFALYSVPVILGTNANISVLSVRIVQAMTASYPPETGLAIGLSLFVVAAVGGAWYLQGRILRSERHATVGGRGLSRTRVDLGDWRWVARLLPICYVVIAAVLPIIALVLVALNGFWTPNINWGKLSLTSFRLALAEDPLTSESLRNSVGLGVVGATIGIVSAAIVSLTVVRSRRRVAKVIDGIIKFPAAISTIVIAVGFILAFSGPPFNLNDTLLLLLLAYIVLYIPQGSVAADVAVAQLGKELPEASRICGAGGGRTFLRVSLPVMLPALAAGWALLFVRMAGDLEASVILAGTNTPVVGFRILDIFENGNYSELAALAVTLTIITSVVTVFALAATRRRTSLRPTPAGAAPL